MSADIVSFVAALVEDIVMTRVLGQSSMIWEFHDHEKTNDFWSLLVHIARGETEHTIVYTISSYQNVWNGCMMKQTKKPSAHSSQAV